MKETDKTDTGNEKRIPSLPESHVGDEIDTPSVERRIMLSF